MFGAIVHQLAWAQSAETKEKVAALPKVNGDQLVSIDFNDVDIVVFIKFISDLTKQNFVIDDKVKGKVTIISPGKITVSEAYRVFLSVLEVHDYTVVPSGQITKIVPSPDARSKSIKTRLEEEAESFGDNVVTQIIPLRYADPNEIKRLFTPLVSKSSVILAYAPTNTLIITDVQSNIKRLLHILKAIDITGVGQQIAIIPVEYADATKLATLLGSIFTKGAKGKGAAEKDITFVADERTNAIVLLASEGDTDNIRKLIKTLDKKTPKGQAKIHVYYLENASAEDVAAVLQDIPQKDGADNKTAGKKSSPVVSDKVRIAADKATNSLIITADMEDYVVLEGIIKKIDIPRAMVYIEALIMEVNVEKDFRLGTEWLAGGETSYDDKGIIYGGGFSAGGTSFGGDAGVLGSVLNSAGTGALVAPGFSLGLFGEAVEIAGISFPSISAIVQAYKKDSDVEILSTPQILTTDNQEAKIYVGKNVPFQTAATATTTGSGDVYNSYDYRDVGKTLTITPHINKDRMVRLELALEVSSVEDSTDFRPTTLKRTVETTAIARDGNTLVLGGLIDRNTSKSTYRVPCLGDIPGLGYLFRKTAKGDEKTNLYIFLTPRVIQNPTEATMVTKEKREKIDRLREENIKLYDKVPITQELDPQLPQVESFEYQEEVPPPAEVAPTSQNHLPAADTGNAGVVTETSEPPPEAITSSAVQDKKLQSQSLKAPPKADTVPEETGPTPSAPATGHSAAKIGAAKYSIQVASVQTAQQADQALKQFTDKGYAAYTVRTAVDNKTWYRIRIGYFDRPEATHELMERLRSDHFDPILIKF